MVRAITPPIMNSLIVCFCHRLRSHLTKWPVPYAPAQDTDPRQRYFYVQIKKTI